VQETPTDTSERVLADGILTAEDWTSSELRWQCTKLAIASAIEAGCDTLYSEDLQHGRTIGSVAIVDPFFESAP
jgi:predicted nucleic acid-binding protein